jgi:hypothetical protein
MSLKYLHKGCSGKLTVVRVSMLIGILGYSQSAHDTTFEGREACNGLYDL